MLEELVGVELLARRRPETIFRTEEAQDRLHRGKDCLGGRHRVQVPGTRVNESTPASPVVA